MDSFFIEKSAENTDSFDSCDKIYESYDFSEETLANPPHSDENSCSQAFDSDEIHLPPPPGTSDQSPPISRSFLNKNPSPPPDECTWSSHMDIDDSSQNAVNITITDSYDCQVENISLPPPPQPLSEAPALPPLEEKQIKFIEEENVSPSENELAATSPEILGKKLLEESKYSPTKTESDDESPESSTAKPKLLGKEAAKKRLMAFSLSKQPTKKQNKISPPVKTNKEKSSNSNKSVNVQDVFRTTISEIEEEKRKMLQNLPHHLALELNDLSKYSAITTSTPVVDGKTPTADSEIPKKEIAEPNSKGKNEVTSNNSTETSKTQGPVKKSKSGSPSKTTESQTKVKRSRSRSNRRSGSKSKRRRRSRSKENRNRRRSRSKSITNQSRSRRRSRSRSRRKRSGSRSRRRSRSRNRRRSGSGNKNFNEQKNEKQQTAFARRPTGKDWKSFKAAGLTLPINGESEETKTDGKDSTNTKHSPGDWSPRNIIRARSYFRPVFNLLKRKSRSIATLRVTPADPDNSKPILYPERILRYTRTRPIIHWAENPTQTTEFYITKDLLLENCDYKIYPVLLSVMEGGKKGKSSGNRFEEPLPMKTRSWYPRQNSFIPSDQVSLKSDELNFGKNSSKEVNKGLSQDVKNAKTSKKEIEEGEIVEDKRTPDSDEEFEEKISVKGHNEQSTSRERKTSPVGENFLSHEDGKAKSKETIVDVIKQPVTNLNDVRIRSKWDSDFDGETSEVEGNTCKEEDMDISTSDDEEKMTASLIKQNFKGFDAKGTDKEDIPEKMAKDSRNSNKSKDVDVSQRQNSNVSSNPPTGNLVSEYEEFLKMVSFDSCDADGMKTQEKRFESADGNLGESKLKKVEKPVEVKKNIRVEATDWDQESDHEEKSDLKKIDFSKSEIQPKFSAISDDKLDSKKKKIKKNVIVKKKNEKAKIKKKKVSKKPIKGKKKNYKDSSSSDSSSGSSDSDSYSDSDDSDSPKRKKKKISKRKKKSKRDSSSESESDDSTDEKSKKKKTKKTKKDKKRKSSSSESDEVHDTLMKQLDFNKQLIMKKIEEIDCISERSGKKKGKENQQKRKDKYELDESEILEKYIKAGKKKKNEEKSEKEKKMKNVNKKSVLQGKTKKAKVKKRQSSSESESEDSEDSVKRKKIKKEKKRKWSSSESSDSDEKSSKGNKIQNKLEKMAEVKSFKTKEKKEKFKKIKKLKKKKRYTSSESDSVKHFEKDDTKSKTKKKDEEENSRKDEIIKSDWKGSFLLDKPTFKATEDRSGWEDKELDWKDNSSAKKPLEGTKKGDDWEASSSIEESPKQFEKTESSWDEEDCSRRTKTNVNKEVVDEKKVHVNADISNSEKPEKVADEKSSSESFEGANQHMPENLKTSLSNFSFNENSFCAFGQELSRDFFLMEPTLSNSAQFTTEKTKEAIIIESRPFQSVSKSSDVQKPTGSELYSPGCSESEASDVEPSAKIEKSIAESKTREETPKEVYDPLNCESEGSVGNDEVELSSIPLPRVSDILLPGESQKVQNVSIPLPETKNQFHSHEKKETPVIHSSNKTPTKETPSKFSFTSSEFTPIKISDESSLCILKEDLNNSAKKQVISMKGQRKLKSKAASVFQDESDEDFETTDKAKFVDNMQNEHFDNFKEKIVDNAEVRKSRDMDKVDSVRKEEVKEKKRENEVSRSRSREKSKERERRNSEKKDYAFTAGKAHSPRKMGTTSEMKILSSSKEKPEIKSDSFEIEPLNSFADADETIQRIPVVTGLGAASSDRHSWNRSHLTAYGCTDFPEVSSGMIDHADSFDLYPVDDLKFRNQNYEKDFIITDVSSTSSEKPPPRTERNKKERRKSRSRSLSPRRKRRSKSPERRKSPRGRSPRKRSISPRRKDKSPYSPRRRSPKRKSYRSSRTPERRRKSRSRSPRKRRTDSRRSKSLSPKKHRSPKRRGDSPRRDSPSRSFSPRGSVSPRKDSHFNHYSDNVQKRIPVIGGASEDVFMEISPSTVSSPRLEIQTDFPRYHPDPNRTVSDMNGSFYNREYSNDFGIRSYSEEVSMNNLITVKSHDIEKPSSPERLSLDQRIELELAGQMTSNSQSQSEQYPVQNQVCQQFPEMSSSHFPSSYNCENANSGENFYQNQSMPMNSEMNSQYFNGHQQQPNYGQFPPYTSSQGVKSSVLQVGNIVEVVPTLQHPPPPPPPPPVPSKPHQILQVGNVLQVVPSPKVVQPPVQLPVPPPTASQNFGPTSPMAPVVKTQKATAVVAPSSIVPTPNPEAVINPLIKAIQLEREKRRKEKEKRRAEREARRKARQLRREAKLMSVNEKLKKSVQDEGLMLGQEVEDDELLDGSDIPSPPIPVEIITVSSQSTLPPAGKGILITAGFMPKPPSEKKEVKFADGVCPGEGTSTSGNEDIASPPPKPKLPKEKRYKKKKTKVKKKVKVEIIRQIIQDEEDEEEDDLSPPPPPPGDPPPVFFARFPFVGDAQFPIYQTQTTTTTTLTTVQYPAQSFQ